MKRKPPLSVVDADIRRRAETLLRAKPHRPQRQTARPTPDFETQALVHELQVHQMELELQNVELRQTRDELEALLENYTNLYDFAPVGYFTLTASGAIRQLNLTGSDLLGGERSRLLGRLFGQSVAPELRPAFHAFLKRAFATPARQTGDFELVIPHQPRRIVNLEARRVPQGGECRVVALDITERKLAERVQRRLEVLSTSNRKLEREISRRKAIETALRLSQQHKIRLLKESKGLQKQLTRLPRLLLSAQEEERKRISRELHDMIAQTLTGINLSLEYLSAEAEHNVEDFRKKLPIAHMMVSKAVDMVHNFARELRPAVLDDLGLVPALRTFLRDLTTRTGIRAELTVKAFADRLEPVRRTVLFRVAQEALNNVTRHAGATHVEVRIRGSVGGVSIIIQDDGKAFEVARVLRSTAGKRLGLLGMRERVEMVGGKLEIKSARGQGTTVTAKIPLGKAPKGKALPSRISP